jgi:N-acyl amino acid synthase of PEP-CTERM/exosortase system
MQRWSRVHATGGSMASHGEEKNEGSISGELAGRRSGAPFPATAQLVARPDGERPIEVYRRSFEAMQANTEELLEQAYRLRYQVYCVENPFEDPADNPGGLETDAFDAHAVHSLLIHRPSGVVMGTVRLVLPLQDAPERSFAIQRVCNDPLLRDLDRFPILQMGEISRFCISKQFRQRVGDQLYPAIVDTSGQGPSRGGERRTIPSLMPGLIEALVRMSIENGIAYWCAVMEPTLLRLLRRLGIYFDNIGPMVKYHGKRQPCYKKLDVLLERVCNESPDVWDLLTDGGRHWEALQVLQDGGRR